MLVNVNNVSPGPDNGPCQGRGGHSHQARSGHPGPAVGDCLRCQGHD